MVVGNMASFPSLPPSFRRTSSQRSKGDAKDGGVKSFVNEMLSPFTACWQPSMSSCVPGCSPSDYQSRRFGKTSAPSVVTPSLVDRTRRSRHYSHATSPESPVSPNYEYQPTSRPPPSVLKASDQPQVATDIEKPHSTDVLCGRGGSSNRHLGNMHFRELVAANKKMYVGLTKKQKMLVARKIVEMAHSTKPPGRFLAKDLDTGLWYDIGVPRSLEKTSQALREKNSNDFSLQQGQDAGSDFLSDASGPASPRSDSGVSSPVSMDDRSTSKSSRSSKNVEAPPLTIPPHLMLVFGPKRAQDSHHSWPDYPPSSQHLEQPFLHSYPPSQAQPASPPRDHYHMTPRPRTHSHPYDSPPPPRSPHRHPYDYNHSEPPRYSSSSYCHPESPQDLREHYDYYSRRPDPRDHYVPPSPHRVSSHSGRLPPPPPGHYRGYPPHPPPPPRPSHHRSHQQRHHHPPPRPVVAPSTPPVSSQTPPHYEYHRYGGLLHPSTPTLPPAAPRSSSSYRSPNRSSNNTNVRGKSEVSPERRQEWKRQRNERGVPRRLSESSLTHAVQNSLTLEERVVGRERRPVELKSPSITLQARSRPRSATMANRNKSDKETDLSALSGLAALSTAASLQRDEN